MKDVLTYSVCVWSRAETSRQIPQKTSTGFLWGTPT